MSELTPTDLSPADRTRSDQIRRVVVIAAEIFCVLGTLVGIGVLGTSVSETAGGALSADATLLAPATTAFTIWTPIYPGLAGYTVWQFLPSTATHDRVRATGWLAAVSMVLNAVWLLVTQRGWVWLSVVIILALAVVLGLPIQRLCREPARSATEKVLVDTTFGLYLGWVAVATCANVTAAFVDSGVDLGSTANQVAAVVVVIVAAALGCRVRHPLRWPLGRCSRHGLGPRLDRRRPPHRRARSTVTALAAVAAAIVVLAAAVLFHRRERSSTPRMVRGPGSPSDRRLAPDSPVAPGGTRQHPAAPRGTPRHPAAR